MKIRTARLTSVVVVSTLTFIAASVLSASHPVFGAIFEIVGMGCSLCLILIWLISQGKAWGRTVQKQWGRVRSWLRTHTCEKKVPHDTIVPIAQLEHVRQNVQRFGLALYGMTPEMENARRMHFKQLGDALPPLALPPQNAVLSAEFASLIKTLTHFGFPSLESVRLQQKDLAFIQHWGNDLEARLWQQYQCSFEQQAAVRMALVTVAQQHKALGEMWAFAQHYSGYQRIQGALWLLETMVSDNRCHWDLAQTYVQALQSDIKTLVKQCEQAIV